MIHHPAASYSCGVQRYGVGIFNNLMKEIDDSLQLLKSHKVNRAKARAEENREKNAKNRGAMA